MRLLLTTILFFSQTAFALPTFEEAKTSGKPPLKIQPTGKDEWFEPKTNGVCNGLAFGYFANGNLKNTSPCKDGKWTGVHTTYLESGIKYQETAFVDNLFEGVARWFDQKGEVFHEVVYSKNAIVSQRTLLFPSPYKPPETDDLSKEIRKAFTPSKNVTELIPIALKERADTNLSQNIKNRAYSYLLTAAEDAEQKKIILEHKESFIKDLESSKDKSLQANISKLIIELNPEPKLKEEVAFTVLQNIRLSEFNKSEQTKNEKRAIDLIRVLFADKKSAIANASKLIEWMGKPYNYSLPALNEALGQLEKIYAQIDQQTLDQLVKRRFDFEKLLATDRKRRSEHSSNVTIWNFHSETEAQSYLAQMDRVICMRPLKPGIKIWDYHFITRGSSENGLEDVSQRLLCKR